MRKEIEEARLKLTESLIDSDQITEPLTKLNRIVELIDTTIRQLNEWIQTNPFEDEQDEITFFKTDKPELIALKIQALYEYSLTVNKPIGTSDIRRKFYEDEIKSLQGFFRMHAFNYQYFKSGVTHHDQLYFLRNGGPLPVPIVEIGEMDAELVTPMSYLFARFIAYENVQYFILEKIAELAYPELNLKRGITIGAEELSWTGDAINIIEVAYGIWLTGQLNNGNASLTQIVRWLESNLKVTIGNIQSRFAEISSRKRLSPTKFIDQMKDAILKRIDNNNA